MELSVTAVSTLVNPEPGDLELSEQGLEVVRTALAEEVSQRLRIMFNFFAGEWFLNLDAGTPWFQYLLVKDPKDRLIRSVVSAVIRSCPGVSDVISISYAIDSRSRTMSLRFKLRLEDSSTFVSTDFGQFVITV